MYLNHIDYNNTHYKKELEELYLSAFPDDERFPFWLIKRCAEENNVKLNAILDGEQFIGMEYIVNCDNAYYLMYFAIDEKLRNKNYGSKTLADLKEKYETIFLSIEKPCDEITKKRKNFYLKNGFFETNKYYEDTGVEYEILCTNKEYMITEENVMKRYTNMSESPLIRETIGKIFNTDKVVFLDNSKTLFPSNKSK